MKNIISYGGGTQSTALILMALEGMYDLTRPDFAVYADTGGEPEFINEYVIYFKDLVKQEYNFDIHIIMKDKGLVDYLLHGKKKSRTGRFYTSSTPPYFTLSEDGNKGMLNRQCTSDYKIHPISKFITGELGRAVPYRLWMGISFEERSRMKISTTKKVINYYPLVDNYVKRMDSVKYVMGLGVRMPQRSSCYFCPYHSDRYWKWLKKDHPDEFQKAIDFELAAQERQSEYMTDKPFLHRSCIPLSDVRFEDDTQLNLFPELIDECDGYCGI